MRMTAVALAMRKAPLVSLRLVRVYGRAERRVKTPAPQDPTHIADALPPPNPNGCDDHPSVWAVCQAIGVRLTRAQ